MKTFATLYSLVLACVSSWAWITHFLYRGSTEEHLLPAIALNVVTLPSSMLMDTLVVKVPWILSSPITMLSSVTILGLVQTGALWLLVRRVHKTA